MGGKNSPKERERYFDFEKEEKWKKEKWISFSRLSFWETDTKKKKKKKDCKKERK